METHLTRWQQFYLEDASLADIPPSVCASEATKIFAEGNCRLILDLGCGAGRDSLLLAGDGLQVIGVDAARSGLLLARQRAAAHPVPVDWVECDARALPFADGLFDGVFCFGLLHEFVGETAGADVSRTLAELYRVLRRGGTAVVAVSAGDPRQGLPHVQNFSATMFAEATSAFHCLDRRVYDDLGCTGRTDYRVWFGHFQKPASAQGLQATGN